ncbi:TPA: DUF3987 domain-containing protein [Vibrio parahaemolyticus]|uniref:YfjI family protein n=1 Tax=Vibrio parahaemolyticus TaxID=670 RepID=UPI00248CE862|nr:YfjI family protein [Vibrio parahaemolyticus]HBK3325501.1 DUF3987 domain-containing protein [Vibrio parahaemolyticus]
MNYYNHQFPVDGGITPRVNHSRLISNAFNEAKVITQAPDPMVYVATINAVSVAMQGLIDVEMPTGKVAPVSLMSLIIAESGERKSSLENLLTKGIKSFQKENAKLYHEKLKEYEIREMIFNKRKKQIEKSFDLTDSAAMDQMAIALLEHQKYAPCKPKLGSLCLEDSTTEALLHGLSEHTPNAYLGSSEGGVLLNSRAMSNTASLNAIWSGDEVTVNRKTAGNFTLERARLTINIMTQRSAFERFLNKNKDDVRGNGFLSRLIVCAPESNCGFRQSNGVVHASENLNAFNERTRELMLQASELKDFKARKKVRFSDEAKNIWLDIANDIESKMAPGGVFEHVKDHASKLPENIGRLAALIHHFDELSEEGISKEALFEAIDLIAYFSREFIKVFSLRPKYEQDAESLYYWLGEHANMGVRYVKRNKLLQFGPNGTRNKKSLDIALDYLKTVQPFGEILVKKTKVIDLFPDHPYDESKLKNDLLIDVVL